MALIWQTRYESSTLWKMSYLAVCDMWLAYSKTKATPPSPVSPPPQKKWDLRYTARCGCSMGKIFPKLSRKALLEIKFLSQVTARFEKPTAYNFCKSTFNCVSGPLCFYQNHAGHHTLFKAFLSFVVQIREGKFVECFFF